MWMCFEKVSSKGMIRNEMWRIFSQFFLTYEKSYALKVHFKTYDFFPSTGLISLTFPESLDLFKLWLYKKKSELSEIISLDLHESQ